MRFKKLIVFLILFNLISLNILSIEADELNPTREELEKMIEEVAIKRAIPPVIFKAIARTESVFKHYNSDGSVLIGSSGSIGLMQIHNSRGTYDSNRLKNDIYYNIEAGADILLEKWAMSVDNKIPTVGNMDPDILESWYFPLWAYNGYVSSNNPNMIPYYYSNWTKHYAYQDLLYKVIRNEYNQEINSIDIAFLPAEGLPSKTLNVPYPENFHNNNILLYKEGDRIAVKTKSNLNLRETPNGKIIGKVSNGEEYIIDGEAILEKGYYWHKIKDDDGNVLGWVARNWLELIESNSETQETEKSNEKTYFEDIQNHWAKEYIESLHEKNIVKGKTASLFEPDAEITKEEFFVMLDRVLILDDLEKDINIKDKDDISDWSRDAIARLIKNEIIHTKEELLLPKSCIKRKEVVEILGRVIKDNKNYKDIYFEDIDALNIKELQGLVIAYSEDMINGKGENIFAPEDLIKRGEISKLLNLLYEKELNYKIK